MNMLTAKASFKKTTLFSMAFVVAFSSLAAAVPFILAQKAAAIEASEIIYNALPSVVPQTSYQSQPFQAQATSEVADSIHLGGSNRILNEATVTMVNWAKYSDYSSNPTYSGNSTSWSQPITVNVYKNQLGANGAPDTLLATKTQSFNIPWRPESDPTCSPTSNGEGWKVGTACYNFSGLANNITFDLRSLDVTIPSDVIVGVAYNTQTYGANPTTVAGPYNSLNVALPANQPVSVGNDVDTGSVFWNSTYLGRSAGLTVDSGWTPNGTLAMQITAVPIPAPLDVYVDDDYTSASAGGHVWNYDAFANIQEGIDAVGANGTVHLLNGLYTEKVTFTKSDVKLVGEDKNNTIIKPLSNAFGMGVTADGVSGITISDVTVSANSATSGGSAIKFSNASNVVLQNAIVTGNNTYMRGVDANGVDGIIIDNVQVSDFGKNGIVFTAKYNNSTTYNTQNVRVTNVTSTHNGWFGIVFYNLSSTGLGLDIQNVRFTGSNSYTNNGQFGFGVIGDTDANFMAGTTPAYKITGASGAIVDLGATTFGGNTLGDIVNYQTTDLVAGGAAINGKVGSAMTVAEFAAVQAKIIDRNDNVSYGRVFLTGQTAPVVTFNASTPANNAVVRGTINNNVSATDDYGMGSYYLRFWKNAYEVAGGGTLVGNCGNAPGAFLLGKTVTASCSYNTTAVTDGTKIIVSAQFLDGDNAWGSAQRTVTVDNTAPTISVKTGSTSSVDGTLGTNPYDHVSFKLFDAAGNLKEVELNGHIYGRSGTWNDLNWSNITKSHLSQGLNTIIVRDKAGNVSSQLVFNYDSLPPAAPVINNSPVYVGASQANGQATWSHDGADVDHFEYREYMSIADANADANGKTASYWTPVIAASGRTQTVGQSWTGEQTLYYRVVAIDTLGHRSAPSALGMVIIDKNAPTATLGFPIIGATGTSFTVQFSEAVNPVQAEDPANYFLSNWIGAGGSGNLVGDANIFYDPATFKATVSFTTPGWYVSPEQLWGVENVQDLAGNLLSVSPKTAYSTPNVVPGNPGTPTVSSPATSLDNVWNWGAATDANGANGSGVKGYEYAFVSDGSEPSDWTFTTATTAPTSAPTDGTYTLFVRTIDNAGNKGDEVVGSVTIDTTPPEVDFDTLKVSATDMPTISGTINDPSATIALQIDGGDPIALMNDGTSWTYTFTTPLSQGDHTLVVAAEDGLKNFGSQTATLTISVPTNPSPQTPQEGTAAPGVPTTPIPLTTVIPAAVPAIVNPATFAEVLGETTDNTSASNAAETKGASTENRDILAVAADSEANKGTFLGLGWYWWLLIIAAVAATAWWIVGAIRNRQAES